MDLKNKSNALTSFILILVQKLRCALNPKLDFSLCPHTDIYIIDWQHLFDANAIKRIRV